MVSIEKNLLRQKSSIILKNLKGIEKSFTKNKEYVDLDYRGVDPNVISIEIRKGTPILNAYKMWLQSKKSAYIRRYGLGGYLHDELHHKVITDENEKLIKEDILQITSSMFPNIIILKLDVKGIPEKRTWSIKVAVQDKITKMVSFDMYALKQSIIIDKE